MSSLVLTLVWTFNVSALTLTHRADAVRRVVTSSWDLLVTLAYLQLAWAGWIIYTGQPPILALAACYFGLNLMLTIQVARQCGAQLRPSQVVLLCSWWLGLVGMVVRAAWEAGFLPLP